MRLDAHLLNLIRTAARRRRPLPAASFLVAIVVVVATLAASLTLLLTSDTAHGANFTVTTGSDGVDLTRATASARQPGSPAGLPGCTLRAAIMEANALDGDDTITLPPVNTSSPSPRPTRTPP